MTTMTSATGSTPCGCGVGAGCSCDTTGVNRLLERPRYFAGQLITPTELNLEHAYLRDKLRRLTLFLHGWGVVCGAEVTCVLTAPTHAPGLANSATSPPGQGASPVVKPEPWKVKVLPGYILGPCGDEIVLACEQIVDVRTQGIVGLSGDPTCGGIPAGSDPWSSDPTIRNQAASIYIAVRFREMPCRPVQVQPLGCDCSGSQCEYSRWRDSYEIGVLDQCPSPLPTLSSSDPQALSAAVLTNCPNCADSPWVALAKVTLDSDGRITCIDNCAQCRRTVVSFFPLVAPCYYQRISTETVLIVGEQGKQVTLSVVPPYPDTRVQPLAFDLGPDISVNSVPKPTLSPDGRTITFSVNVQPTAIPGARNLSITMSDGSMACTSITVSRG
jgi:hypothetical protein